MTQFTRIGSYLILSFGLLLAAVAMNSWLQRQTQAQTRQLNEAAVSLKREQFKQATDKMPHGMGEVKNYELDTGIRGRGRCAGTRLARCVRRLRYARSGDRARVPNLFE